MYNNNNIRFKSKTKLPRSIEPVGIIPRSIIRTLNRFLTQLFQNSNNLVIEEFRISRYQILVSLQSLLSLIFIPLHCPPPIGIGGGSYNKCLFANFLFYGSS